MPSRPLSLALLAACFCLTVPAARAALPAVLTRRAPEKAKPWVPGWGFYPRAPGVWLRYHTHLAAGRGRDSLVFFGDSLTFEWPNKDRGRTDWQSRYVPLGVRDYGVGGDTTRQALWRITQGELDGLHPRLVVLLIGTDNLGDALSDGTNAEVAAGIAAVVHALRRRLPRTHILLLGLLPRQDTSYCRRVAAVNSFLPALADGSHVRYLDMGHHFLLSPGHINHALYTHDQLHLNAAGYHSWAAAMQPIFDNMRQEKTGTLTARYKKG